MSNVSQELKTEATVGAGDSPIMREVVMTDNPSLQITIVKLVKTNFLTWSRSAILSIQSRGPYSYLIGNSTKPEVIDPKYEKWIAESLVMPWLLHLKQPNVSRCYMLLSTAHEIWWLYYKPTPRPETMHKSMS